MSKTNKILLGIISSIICFGISAFGMYQYSNYKNFNALVTQGNQYMLQKDYDKAIQSFQQALSYKSDSTIQNTLLMAQNLKSENTKNDTVSKNIQLATEAAKNGKYDEANKYIDEVLKTDPNNTQAKNLKDTYTKTVQQQEQQQAKTETQSQEKTKTENQTQTVSNTNTPKPYTAKITPDQALQIVKNKYPGYNIRFAIEAFGKTTFVKVVPKQYIERYYSFYILNDVPNSDYLVFVNTETGETLSLKPNFNQ